METLYFGSVVRCVLTVCAKVCVRDIDCVWFNG